MSNRFKEYLQGAVADSEMNELLLDDANSAELDIALEQLWDSPVVPLEGIDRERILSRIKSSRRVVEFKPRKSYLRIWISSVAAVLVLGLVVASLFYKSEEPAPVVAVVEQAIVEPEVIDTVETVVAPVRRVVRKKAEPVVLERKDRVIVVPVGEILEHTFICGTVAQIHGGSRVSFDENFTGDSRTVTVEGVAQFKVAKNGKPFMIDNEFVDITVLGTEFLIDNQPDKDFVFIKVESGVVNVKTIKGADFNLTAGQEIVIVNRKPEEK